MKHIHILLLAGIAGCIAMAFAQPQTSEDFQITKAVVDAGGAPSTSEDFRLVSAFGQPSPLGAQTSESFLLWPGFLTPTVAISPLSPIQALVIHRVGTTLDMQLDWELIDGAMSYVIYRDTDPSFTPGPGKQIGNATDDTFTDVNALGLPLTKYFYSVSASVEMLPTFMSRAERCLPPQPAPQKVSASKSDAPSHSARKNDMR